MNEGMTQMASKYFVCWLPAAFSLYIDTIFHQRYCVHVFVQYLKIAFRSEKVQRMAVKWTRYRGIMSKYYWSFVVAFAMSMFVVLYYCFNEDALTDDVSNQNMNVFGRLEFDDSQIFSTENVAKYSQEKESTSTKCNNLYETAWWICCIMNVKSAHIYTQYFSEGRITPKDAYEILGFSGRDFFLIFRELFHRSLGFLRIFKHFEVFVKDFQTF